MSAFQREKDTVQCAQVGKMDLNSRHIKASGKRFAL